MQTVIKHGNQFSKIHIKGSWKKFYYRIFWGCRNYKRIWWIFLQCNRCYNYHYIWKYLWSEEY